MQQIHARKWPELSSIDSNAIYENQRKRKQKKEEENRNEHDTARRKYWFYERIFKIMHNNGYAISL